MLQEALRTGVGKVVHTSSSAVFGMPAANPVLPSTVPSPVEAYGLAKLAAEWACLDARRRGLDVTIVRPRTILGHGRLGIFGILFDWVADGADIFVLGDGYNRYQFVHADDLAEVCILRRRRRRPRRVQRRHRPLRHDARVARVALCARRHRLAGAIASGAAGSGVDEGRGRLRASPRSRRTTG